MCIMPMLLAADIMALVLHHWAVLQKSRKMKVNTPEFAIQCHPTHPGKVSFLCVIGKANWYKRVA